jgi:hypothetical protein
MIWDSRAGQKKSDLFWAACEILFHFQGKIKKKLGV